MSTDCCMYRVRTPRKLQSVKSSTGQTPTSSIMNSNHKFRSNNSCSTRLHVNVNRYSQCVKVVHLTSSNNLPLRTEIFRINREKRSRIMLYGFTLHGRSSFNSESTFQTSNTIQYHPSRLGQFCAPIKGTKIQVVNAISFPKKSCSKHHFSSLESILAL